MELIFKALKKICIYFVKKKKQKQLDYMHVNMKKKGCGWVSHTKLLVKNILVLQASPLLYPFSLCYFQICKAPGFRLFPSPPSKCICDMDLISPLCSCVNLDRVLLLSEVSASFLMME